MTDWYSAETATMGDRIAAAREAAGLTQQGMAERIGVRRRTLLDWENDRAEPRANRLTMMSGILGVSMRWLMTGVGEDLVAPADGEESSVRIVHLRAELAQMREICDRLRERIRALEEDLSR